MQYVDLIINCESPLLLEEMLEEEVISIITKGSDGFEIYSEDILSLSFSRWQLSIVPKSEHNIIELMLVINNLCSNLSIDIVACSIKEDAADYINMEQKRYSIDIGNFVIFNHAEDYAKFYSKHKIALLIKQSTAFGTGSHESTSLCLDILSDLFHKNYKFNSALDLGTGSGILALGVAKLFDCSILAVDNDPLALATAKEFIKLNNAENNITTTLSSGFAEITGKKFDLIVANILLNPLVDMVDEFYSALEDRGILILAGFLDNQLPTLEAIFKQNKFILNNKKTRKGWVALVLNK